MLWKIWHPFPFPPRIGCVVSEFRDYKNRNYPRQYKVMNDTMRMLSRVNRSESGDCSINPRLWWDRSCHWAHWFGIDFPSSWFLKILSDTREFNGSGIRIFQMIQILHNLLRLRTEFQCTRHRWFIGEAHTGRCGIWTRNLRSRHWRREWIGSRTFSGCSSKSDIIAVSFNFSIDAIPHLSHAIEYIFTKSATIGKNLLSSTFHWVIIFGSHDGTDLESEYISNLINQQSGRVMVASAGNIGVNFTRFTLIAEQV